MRAAWTMWKNTRMIILVAVCAAIYSAALVAFKTAIPLIPGITEVRVGNVFPMTFGLMFGPAGAWGAGLGNLIGDLFGGTFGPGSLAGFLGNFLLAYLPYTLWTSLVPFSQKSRAWQSQRWQSWACYFLIAFISAAACAVVISACVDALGIVPYTVLSKIITINNTVASWIGVILLITVFNITKDHLNLFWADVMDASEIGRPLAAPIGAWIVTIASVIGLVGQYILGLPVPLVAWGSTLAILIGSLLL